MRMRHRTALMVLVCGTVFSYPSFAQFEQQGPKLVATGAIGTAHQGNSVSLSADGNTAIVGGYGDNDFAGGAWVWTRNGGVWTQQGNKLVGSGAALFSMQGSAVALSADGNTAIVGGQQDDGVGAVWVWTRSGGGWTQQGNKLVGSGGAGYPSQGWSVALSADGNTAIVGGINDNYDNGGPGAAWIWTRNGGTWTQQGNKLVGSGAAGNAWQGASVAISADGNTAIVGGFHDSNGAGAAWVWTRSGGVWTPQGNKLVGSGAVAGVGGVYQGYSVSLSADGNTAIVGGVHDNYGVGAAWIWTRSGGVWTQQGTKLAAAGGFSQGWSVSLSADGNTAIVGGAADNNGMGAAWSWTRSGGVWTQYGTKLVGSGAVGNASQGGSVALSADANTAIVGGNADNGDAGAAWIFAEPAADLTITKTHTGNFRQGDTGDTYTIRVTNSGSASTYGTVTVTDTLPTGLIPTAPNGVVSGWSCSISGQTLTCTRSDVLTAGASYPAITLTLNVATDAPSSVTNTATVSGGGETNTADNRASDGTTIDPILIPATPTGLTAAAVSSTRVDVAWTAAARAASYQVDRKAAGGGFSPIGTSMNTSFSDTTASADSAYLYRVRAVNAHGVSSNSPADLATTVVFVDSPLQAGNFVKAVHLFQLRTAVNAVQLLAGLAPANFTEAATAGMEIRAVHTTELRSTLEAARVALGLPTGGYTNATLTGIVVKAVHLQELRENVGSGTVLTPTLSITTMSLPSATVDTAYGEEVTASGGQAPYTWSVSSGLPPGLVIHATSGSIFGTPTVAGTFNFTVTVRDNSNPQQVDAKGLSITVAPDTSPPGTFTLSSATPSCSGSSPRITVNWTAASEVTTYDVYRDGLLYEQGLQAGTQSLLDTSVSPGTNYTYFIRASNSAGTTDSGSLQATAPTNCGGTQPGAFTLSSPTPGCSGSSPRITLNWTAASGVTTYDVYRNGLLYEQGIQAGTQNFLDTSVSPGTSYTYFVRARNSAGTTDSGSLPATAPSNCGGTKPGDFTLSNATPGCNGSSPRITLNWTAASGVTTYDIYRDGLLLEQGIQPGTQSFPDTSVSPGTSYTYFIRARNSAGTTDSGSLSATAPTNCGGTKPGAFTLSNPTPDCNGSNPQILLSWTAASGVTTYDIYRDGLLLEQGIQAGTQSFPDTSVSPGTSYTYFIRARNSAGTTDSSSRSAQAPTDCGGCTGSLLSYASGQMCGGWGTVTSTLKNVNGANSQGSLTRHLLYTDPERAKDGTNPATFTDVPAGSYLLEGYHEETFWGEEFWTSYPDVAVTAGQTTNVTLTRNYPYGSAAVIKNDATGAVLSAGQTVPAGTTLRAEVTVRNNIIGTSKSVRVRFLFDRSQSASYDFDQTAAAQTISGSGGTRTYIFTYPTTTAGSYKYALAVYTTILGNSVLTDSWTWTQGVTVSAADFTVSVTTPSNDGKASGSDKSFVSTNTLVFTASAGSVLWNSNNTSANGSLSPNSGSGPSYSALPNPPAAPDSRVSKLQYTVTASLDTQSKDLIVIQDEIDKIRQQYIDMAKNEKPARAPFINSGQSSHGNFKFAEIQSDDGAPWALFSIFENMENWRANNGSVPLIVNSGYRTPRHNSLITPAGAPNSQHIYGKAADVASSTADWTAKRNAAKSAGACCEPLSMSGYGHVHADWRSTSCPANW